MKRNQFLAIFAFVFAAMLAGNANAQFGDLINKAKDKINKTTKKAGDGTNVSTDGGSGSSVPGAGSQSNEGARWDLFKCNPEYVGAVNENKLREIVEYNVAGDSGKGGLIVSPNSL